MAASKPMVLRRMALIECRVTEHMEGQNVSIMLHLTRSGGVNETGAKPQSSIRELESN